MDSIILDEQNRIMIERFINQDKTFFGYEQDIELLEQEGRLTEALCRKVFTKIMNKTKITRKILKPIENNEFESLINEVFSKYDEIPDKLKEFEAHNGSYSLEEIYSYMKIAFEMRELNTRYLQCKDLRDIASAAINSIDAIDKYKIELQPEGREELKRVQTELKDLLNLGRTDIQGIQDRVNIYNNYAMNIWNNYLTSTNNVQGSEFRWLVHNINKSKMQGEFRDKYMSTSLITNREMGLFGDSNYGLIIKPKHIISASYKDTYTLNDSYDDENLFMMMRPPIMLPQEIEDINIEQTINSNNEMLNYEKAKIYSEIVADDYEIEGVYYISNGEMEFTKHYDDARGLAEEKGVQLIERDISKYRAEQGLEPITEKNRRNLFENILHKFWRDNELPINYLTNEQEFIENHFQEFYERYMEIKQEEGFSKEKIIDIFTEVARDDKSFGWIFEVAKRPTFSLEDLENARIANEYGVAGITDKQELKDRILYTISEGIQYSTMRSQEAIQRFQNIQSVVPNFEGFKDVYLKLRRDGKLEEKFYESIDLENVSYDRLYQLATDIIEENERKELEEKAVVEKTQEDEIQNNDNFKINEYGEIIRNNNQVNLEPTVESKTETDVVRNQPEDLESEKIEVKGEDNKQPEEDLEGEKIEAKSEDNKQPEEDLEGEKIEAKSEDNKQSEENLWMNRFKSWYEVIDKVPHNIKTKFIKMKSDIINSIKGKINERHKDSDERKGSK